MSTTVMGQCWPLQMPPTPKSVLMSLADQANDQGVCWPAIGSIVKRTCLSERAVQNAITWLQQSGVLVLKREQGRATTYQIIPDGLNGTADLFTAPARRAPPQQVHPRTGSTTPPHVVHPTHAPPAGDPRTSCTQNHKEPTREPKGNRKSASFDATGIPLPDWLDRELWGRWVQDRKARRKPITEQAALEQVELLAAYRAEGHSAESVIRHCIASGYQGLFPPTKRAPGHQAADMVRWWTTEQGIEAKGAELGVERGSAPSETATFEGRVWAAAGDGPWLNETKVTQYAAYRRIRDSEGVIA